MPTPTSKLPARLTLTIGGVFLFILLVHFAGVAVLRYFVEKELHPALPQGTYIGEVQLNLFSGLLEIQDFQLRNEGQLRMRFSQLLLDVNPWRLLGGELHIEQARLSGGYLLVERKPDGSFDLGLPPFGADTQGPPDSEPAPLSLAGARVERVTVEYHDGDLASVLYLEDLQAGAYAMRAAAQEVPVDWQLQWDGRAIAGNAVLSLDRGLLAVKGKVQTALLDIARGQQLARMPQVAAGEAGFQGTFSWQPPRLSLGGAVQIPALTYQADGQQVAASDLKVANFALDLVTTPVLSAELTLPKAMRAGKLGWRTADQGADGSNIALDARLRYTQDGLVDVNQLRLSADRLDWHAMARQGSAEGVRLSGTLQQSLAVPGGLPILDAGLDLASVRFSDAAKLLDLQSAGLKLTGLTLSADPQDEARRRLAARVSLGGGRVGQAASQVNWASGSAELSGSVAADNTRVTTDLTLSGLGVIDPALANGPLSIASVNAAQLELGEQTRFVGLTLKGIALPAALSATAMRIAAVDLNDGSYSPDTGVGIGGIVIDGLQTGVFRDKGGAWQHVMSHRGSTPPSAGGTDRAPADGDSAAWKIGGLRITGDSHVTVADALNPDMKPIRYGVKRLEIGALSSAAPDVDTPFDVALQPDRYSEFVIKGKVRPLAKSLRLSAEGHLHGFGLPSVNGLVANDLGHRFLDGQLDDDFTIKIEKNHLTMANALGIAGLAVEEIPGKEGPPLGTAIALLEDRDGNIKLDVPVVGDLGDPQFKVLGALNPIIMKAVAGTAALAIQPLGSVLLVGGLLANQALKVSFQPALFEPGNTELDATAQSYLSQLAAKLAEKPKLGVRVCGVVAVSERKKNDKGEYVDLEADLLATAQQRADAVRAFLAAKGAGAQQLRNCRPAIDVEPSAKPRVDIRL